MIIIIAHAIIVNPITQFVLCWFQICHSKSGNINPLKIRSYVQAYVEKVQQLRKYKQKKQHDDVNGHKRRLSSRK